MRVGGLRCLLRGVAFRLGRSYGRCGGGDASALLVCCLLLLLDRGRGFACSFVGLLLVLGCLLECSLLAGKILLGSLEFASRVFESVDVAVKRLLELVDGHSSACPIVVGLPWRGCLGGKGCGVSVFVVASGAETGTHDCVVGINAIDVMAYDFVIFIMDIFVNYAVITSIIRAIRIIEVVGSLSCEVVDTKLGRYRLVKIRLLLRNPPLAGVAVVPREILCDPKLLRVLNVRT